MACAGYHLMLVALCLMVAIVLAESSSSTDTGRQSNETGVNPSSERTHICVKYTESGPDNIDDVAQWLSKWVSEGDRAHDYSAGTRNGGNLPFALQKWFDIPKEAFNCPTPWILQGKSQVCDIKTEDYCFTGRGSQADLTNAWAVLQLVARFQISRMVVEGMYTMALVPPDEPGFGKGLTLDFVSLLKDFYNGAYGDSALAAVPLIDTVGTLFLFAPYDLGKVQELWAENARAMAVHGGKSPALKCTFGALMNSTDCLNNPGFGAVFETWFGNAATSDQYRNYTAVIGEIAKVNLPAKPKLKELKSKYKLFREYFMRSMFVRIQQAQNLFIHLQPYDIQPEQGQEDKYVSYWGVFCSAIVTDLAGSWCKDKNGTNDSKAYYPVQITARNGTVQFDYPAWDTVSNYGWDGHVIMGQSNRCADLRQQSWDMRNGWPNIFDVIHDYDKSMAWLNSLDVNNIDFIDCLWSIPILEYSDGPHFTGMDKALDTSSEIGYIISESPLSLKSDRTMWKDDRPKSEQVWEVVDISDYCPRMKAEWNIVTGYFELVENIIRNTLGWGEVTSDDQVVADVFGAQQLVAPGSDAETALGKIQTAACEKQHKDSMAIITKEVVDILINVAAFAATGGMGFFAGLLVGSIDAAVSQTLADTFGLQPYVDNTLQHQFELDDDSQTYVSSKLSPKYKTNKVGDGA